MAGRVENLRPVRPGQVLNPRGANQYSYRSRAHALLEELLLETREDAQETRLRAILDRLVREAERGRPWAIALLLDRVLPKTQGLEHSEIVAASPGALADALQEAAKRLGRAGPDAQKYQPPAA